MSKNIFVALIDSGCRFETHEKVAVNVKDGKTEIAKRRSLCYPKRSGPGSSNRKSQTTRLEIGQ